MASDRVHEGRREEIEESDDGPRADIHSVVYARGASAVSLLLDQSAGERDTYRGEAELREMSDSR